MDNNHGKVFSEKPICMLQPLRYNFGIEVLHVVQLLQHMRMTVSMKKNIVEQKHN